MAAEAEDPPPQPANMPSSTAENANNENKPAAQPPTPASEPQQEQPSSSSQPPFSSSKTIVEADSTPADPPASPPLPARPVALTPGARAQRLNKLFDSTLTHTLAKISLDNFAACYPTIAAQAPHILQSVQRSLVQRMGKLCADGFAKIMTRYEVVARLNELEGLVGDAGLRRKTAAAALRRKGKGRAGVEGGAEGADNDYKDPPTPPHLLPAETVLAAHLAPHLASQQSQLNARLQNMQAANAGLWEEIAAQRAEIDQLLGALESVLKDVDGAAELMDSVPAEELARESRSVEAEMMDV